MKRYECDVERLKALGYSAKHTWDGSWCSKSQVIDCNERQSNEVFRIVADVIRIGGHVEILRNDFLYTVNIYVDEIDFTNTPVNDRYFLSREMTEAEKLEADIFTGKGKDWDIKSV